MKLFLKRPTEMLNIIINLFNLVLTDEETRMPVRDYAAMLYRGLENDIESLQKHFLSCRGFSEGVRMSCRELECNTLEIPYMRNKAEWLIDKTKYIELLDQIEYEQGEGEALEEEARESEEEKMLKNRSVVTFNEDYTRIEPEDIDREFEMSAEEFEVDWEQYEVGYLWSYSGRRSRAWSSRWSCSTRRPWRSCAGCGMSP